MSEANHYKTLNINPTATQAEIKRAYRQLVKIFHPDSDRQGADRGDRIRKINAAYEVLGDPHKRQLYDSYQQPAPVSRAKKARKQPQKTARQLDIELELWLERVYAPVNRCVCHILNPLEAQINELAGDPFDDDLVEQFQSYVEECDEHLERAKSCFYSQPNPSPVAGAAANLYYCLDRLRDGIEEMRLFALNYDDRCLHAGMEMFRIAEGLRREAQAAINREV